MSSNFEIDDQDIDEVKESHYFDGKFNELTYKMNFKNIKGAVNLEE